MPLFISIFKKARNRKLAGVGVSVFCFFIFFFMAGQWISAEKPEWVHQDPLPPQFRNLDSFSLFEAHGQIDAGNALYYGIGPLISLARKADVLVLGNSRPFFAFREEAIQEAEKKSGLTFFSLAGPGDNFPFAREIILRNHLFPRFIILSEEDFFNPKLWPFQKEVMAGSWWHGWSNTYAHYYQWLVQYYTDGVIPRLTFFKANQGKEIFTFRSPLNNFLFLENNSGDHRPLVEQTGNHPSNPVRFNMARIFIAEMRDRGAQVILIYVPNGKDPEFVRKEAEALGVSCVLPSLGGLETFDGIHLTPESSGRFARAFFDLFFKLPEVRKMIRERTEGKPAEK